MNCPLCNVPHEAEERTRIATITIKGKAISYNERYYRNIGETEEANEENISFLCLHNLLREWEENRPQWAEHIPNVHTPTVDAVKHAKWEINIFDGGHSCSRCGCIGKKEYNYCPICGAKMDEE